MWVNLAGEGCGLYHEVLDSVVIRMMYLTVHLLDLGNCWICHLQGDSKMLVVCSGRPCNVRNVEDEQTTGVWKAEERVCLFSCS